MVLAAQPASARRTSRLVSHVAEVSGYNLGMYVGEAAQSAVAGAAEAFFINLRQPIRLLAYTAPATIRPATGHIDAMLQECGPEESWRSDGLAEQHAFLTELAAASDLRRNHFYLITWNALPQTPHALWNTASNRFLGAVHPVRLPRIFDGRWHAEFDYLAPQPDSPDQHYLAFYYAYNFNGHLGLESLHPLFQLPFGVALAIDIDPVSPSTASRRSHNAVNNLNAQMRQHAKIGSTDPGSAAAYQDAQDVTHLLEAGHRLYTVRVALAIRARTREELKENAELLQGVTATLCEIAPARGQQKGLLPYFTDTHRNLIPDPLPDWPWMSGGVGMLTGLFGLPSRNDTRGPLYGVDNYSGCLIFHDAFARDDATAGNTAGNAVVLGQTGSGKTLFLNLIGRRNALYGRQIFFLEPQGHCERLAQILGPEACAYHPLDFQYSRLNILDRAFANPQSQITGVVNLLTLLLSCSVGAANTESPHARHFSTAEVQTLYRALGQVYAPYSWDKPLSAENAPRLEDLCLILHELGTEDSQRLAQEIGGIFVDSALGAIFNAPTNVDLSFRHRAVCFNVHSIDETFRPWIYAVLFQRMSRYIFTRDPQAAGSLLILIDEARHMLNEPRVAYGVRDLVKRIRTRNAAIWLADQDISTYTSTEIGQQIVANSPLVFFGRMEGPNIEQLQPLFPRLTGWHTQGIITAKPGQFVFKEYDNYYQLRVEPSPDELLAFAGT